MYCKAYIAMNIVIGFCYPLYNVLLKQLLIQFVVDPRIYGKKATDIIEGMKKNPSIGIPPVLKR